MRSFAFAPLLLAVGNALPQAAQSCETTTTEVIVPTTTYTFASTYVTTLTATTADDLGTYTEIVRQSTNDTLATVPSTTTDCTASGTITVLPSTTVYTNAGPPSYKREVEARDASSAPCTVTSTFTTTYGATYTYLPASETSTYTRYTDFTQATVTSTSTGGRAFAIATALTTTCTTCGPTVTASASNVTATVTQDARCAPSALKSEERGFGLEYESAYSGSVGTFVTTTEDGSICCQMCTEVDGCAVSTWDIRNNSCKLHFATDYQSGKLNCGQGTFVYYDAGPNHPMAPGTGLYIGTGCGHASYANAKPDDGT